MATIFDTTQTISNSVFNPSTLAAQFGANDITLTIDDYVTISGATFGIWDGGFDGVSLINNGLIQGFDESAVIFQGEGNTLVNNAYGTLSGLFGIQVEGANHTINNHGAVKGTFFAGVWFLTETTDGTSTLINDGHISGKQYGVSVVPQNVPHATANTMIINKSGGVIEGPDSVNTAGLAGFSDSITLDNRGTLRGDVDLNGIAANDHIQNRGVINGHVALGSGDDSFHNFGGGRCSGLVDGQIGNDKLIGGNASDGLNGGAGNDLIRGGRGADILLGGLDRDLFDFNSIKDSVRGSKRDQILDFQHGTNVTGDDIDLKNIDAKKGVSGNQAFKWIGKQDFHDKKGELRYIDKGASCIVQGDVNGDGKPDFEIFVAVGSLVKGDFLL